MPSAAISILQTAGVRRAPGRRSRLDRLRHHPAGLLETSNVNSVDEITSLITAQRAYEMNSKVVTAADQMLQQTSQMAEASR